MRALFLLASLVLLAGCNAPMTVDTSTTSSSDAQPAIEVVSLTGCEGFHTFFTGPAEVFLPFVPENFTLAQGTGGTAQIPVMAFDCEGNTTEIWALLLVVPPVELQNETYTLEGVVLQGLTTNQTLMDDYATLGFETGRMRFGSTVERDYLAAGLGNTDRIRLADDAVSYQVRTTVRAEGGAFEAAHYRYWATNRTHVTGWISVQAPASTSVGLGSADFQQEGDPEAPPVSVGVGHRVTQASLNVTWNKL